MRESLMRLKAFLASSLIIKSTSLHRRIVKGFKILTKSSMNLQEACMAEDSSKLYIVG